MSDLEEATGPGPKHHSWFTARPVFAHDFSGRAGSDRLPDPGSRTGRSLFEQGEELCALAVDRLGRSGMVGCDHVPQRHEEFAACPGILVVEDRSVHAPELGDLPDRHPFVEPEPEQLDAPDGRLAVSRRQPRLTLGGLAYDGPGPGS